MVIFHICYRSQFLAKFFCYDHTFKQDIFFFPKIKNYKIFNMSNNNNNSFFSGTYPSWEQSSSNRSRVSLSICLWSGVFGTSFTSCLTTFCKQVNKFFVPGASGSNGFNKNSCRYGWGKSASLEITTVNCKLTSYFCFGIFVTFSNNIVMNGPM